MYAVLSDDESYIFRPDPLGKIISLSLLITFLVGLTLLCLRSVKLLLTSRWKLALRHHWMFLRAIFVLIILLDTRELLRHHLMFLRAIFIIILLGTRERS